MGFTEINDRFSDDVFFQRSATVGEDLTVLGNGTVVGDVELFGGASVTGDFSHFGDRAYFGGPLTRVDGLLELGDCIVLSNVADPDDLSHWRVCLEPSGSLGADPRMKDFTVRSWLGTTFQVTEEFDPASSLHRKAQVLRGGRRPRVPGRRLARPRPRRRRG